MDGRHRKTVIDTNIAVPTDICIDQEDDFLFWVDVGKRRVERSDLEGKNRRVLVSDNEFDNNLAAKLGLVAVHGEYVYWAVRSSESINHINKRTGLEFEIVKSNVIHLSSLISVNSDISMANPCQDLDCSHMCLVDEKSREARCSCPLNSGLVLQSDQSTCGAPPTCSSKEFTCQSGEPHCIPLQWRCDGQAEC